MEPRKRHRKGQVVPDEGKNNSNFVMDEFDEKPANNQMMPSKFAELANIVANEGNALKLISNVKASASKWKAYATSRRVKRRPLHEKSVVASGQDGTDDQRQAGGLGLDDIHEDFTSVTSFPANKSSMHTKDFEMGIASNRALIQYFAKLGQSAKTDELINLEFVHTLIDSGADINCTDRYGQTVLHEVARAWHTDVAKFLIEIGADINKGDHYGRTALHVAAAVDYPEMINLLIESGADREARTKGENQTPVFYAAKTDAVQSLKALIKKGCLYKEEKDFKGRTPIHVAAELDRSETARILLELQAPVWYADKSGFRAITWMINKMAPVANEALNQFHLTDRPNRKQYFYLNFLCRDKEMDPNGKTQTPLHIAVSFRQYDLLMHTVFIRLLEVMWLKFGRFWALWNLGLNFLYIVIWTVIGISVDYDKKHSYTLPDDGWRIFLFLLAAAFTIYQILEEVMDFLRSQRLHREFEVKRTAEIEKDMEYCHPRWPEEEIYLQAELGEVEKLKPKYFSDMWNIFDWLCYILLLVCIATHIADVFAHSEFMARFHIRIMAITIILLWLRLMKNARAFALLGPFIVMLGHMLKDCVRFLFLYMEFYIPYLAAFWMLFGGTKKSKDNPDENVSVSGYTHFGQLFFSMLRLTLVDEYDYENMTRIDDVMADLLLATWFFLSAILCLNLFIALLSDTFQRVYDNAQANAVMQKAITILNIWEGISHERRERFLKYIEKSCSPLLDTYDDDMTTSGEEDLKKVTIQIKEDLDNFQEMFKLRFGDPQLQFMSSDIDGGRERKFSNGGSAGGLISVDKFESEVDDLRETVQAVKVQQEEMAVRFRKEMALIKSMLRQLLGKDSQDDAEKNVYLERSSTPSELTPVSRMRRKKKKQLLTPDTLSETTSEHRRIPPMLDIETTEFSPATIPDLTRSAHPQAFDVMLSSTTSSQPLPNLDEGGSTNC